MHAAVWRRLLDHVRSMPQEEVCGALVGADVGGSTLIDEVVPLPNEAADPARRFLISGAVVARIEQDSRVAGRSLLGFYHSHPRGGCAPSERDQAEAFPCFLYVIVDAITGDGAAWRLRRDRTAFEPVALLTGEAACR
jgi:desampylase